MCLCVLVCVCVCLFVLVCACVCLRLREQAEGPGAVQGGREETCSVCASLTCALVCVVHTISCAESFKGGGAGSR